MPSSNFIAQLIEERASIKSNSVHEAPANTGSQEKIYYTQSYPVLQETVIMTQTRDLYVTRQ